MNKTLQLDATQLHSLQLTGVQIQVIVLALKELPYKHAQPVIDNLFEQCQPKPEVPSEPPA